MHAAARARCARAPVFVDPPGYTRHRPEATLLYRLVEQHYPALRELRAAAGRALPDYVEAEFDAFLKCGRLEEGFLRLRCEPCHAEKLVAFSCKKRGFCPSCGARRMAETAALLADEVLPERPLRQWVLSLPMALRCLLATRPAVLSQVLGVVSRTISGHLLTRAGVTHATGHTGAVTLLQHFGSALNLNVHLHMIFVDGVYVTGGGGPPVFRPVPSSGTAELQALVQQIAERKCRLLEKRGLIERDAESAWLSDERAQAGPLDDLIGHSVTYRVAVGPRAGQKVFTLQTVPAQGEGGGAQRCCAAGRVLTARRPRYPTRPARKARTAVPLRQPPAGGAGASGTDAVRAGALPAQVHVPRWHDPHRARAAGSDGAAGGAGAADPPAAPRHVAMSWARRLQRVFGIEIEACARCGGNLKIIASIEEPAVIARILVHRDRPCGTPQPELAPKAARAPLVQSALP